jgi:hypothetical protein
MAVAILVSSAMDKLLKKDVRRDFCFYTMGVSCGGGKSKQIQQAD